MQSVWGALGLLSETHKPPLSVFLSVFLSSKAPTGQLNSTQAPSGFYGSKVPATSTILRNSMVKATVGKPPRSVLSYVLVWFLPQAPWLPFVLEHSLYGEESLSSLCFFGSLCLQNQQTIIEGLTTENLLCVLGWPWAHRSTSSASQVLERSLTVLPLDNPSSAPNTNQVAQFQVHIPTYKYTPTHIKMLKK